MTKIGNRRAFDFDMYLLLRGGRKPRSEVSVILVDVDQSKRLNDTFEHQAGDEALNAWAGL